MTKIDAGLSELVVQWDSQTHSQPKGKDHTRSRDRQRGHSVAFDHPDVNFQTNEEQKHHKSDGRRKSEYGHGQSGEDAVGEVGDTAHDGRTEKDTANDFGNDTGLTKPRQEDGEELGEAYNDNDLDHPQREGVRWIPRAGIVTNNDCMGQSTVSLAMIMHRHWTHFHPKNE